jgi:hypothetical protein
MEVAEFNFQNQITDEDRDRADDQVADNLYELTRAC